MRWFITHIRTTLAGARRIVDKHQTSTSLMSDDASAGRCRPSRPPSGSDVTHRHGWRHLSQYEVRLISGRAFAGGGIRRRQIRPCLVVLITTKRRRQGDPRRIRANDLNPFSQRTEWWSGSRSADHNNIYRQWLRKLVTLLQLCCRGIEFC